MSWSTSQLRVRLAPWNRFKPSIKIYFYWPFRGGTSFVDHLCYLCLVFVMLSRLFIAALWSPAGKGLTSWLSFVIFNCVFVAFPCGILGQVWYLIVLIPDLCHLSYLNKINEHTKHLSPTKLQKVPLMHLSYLAYLLNRRRHARNCII